MAKHRETIFCVVRETYEEEDFGSYHLGSPMICAATHSLERAEELKGKYEQEMKDKDFEDEFLFHVQTTTFYDE